MILNRSRNNLFRPLIFWCGWHCLLSWEVCLVSFTKTSKVVSCNPCLQLLAKGFLPLRSALRRRDKMGEGKLEKSKQSGWLCLQSAQVATNYRGPEGRTFKTAEKQPKVPGGPQVKCRANSRDGQPNSRKICFACFGCFPAVFWPFPWHFARGPSGTLFGCFLAYYAEFNRRSTTVVGTVPGTSHSVFDLHE